MLVSFVCIDLWISRHFHLHLHPELCSLFWPQDRLNPEILHPNPRGAMLLNFFFPCTSCSEVLSIEDSSLIPSGLDLMLLQGDIHGKKCRIKILQIKRKCNPADTSHSCKTTSSTKDSLDLFLSLYGPGWPLTHECLQVCNLCQILSCVEMQTDEISVLMLNSVEPSHAYAF